jgi:hypothetical protein
MNDKPFEMLIPLAKSWTQAPKLRVLSGNLKSEGYDFSQRAYRLLCENPDQPSAELVLDASSESPMLNGCFILKNWGDGETKVEIDGHTLKQGNGYRVGEIRTLEGSDVILWIEKKSIVSVKIAISNRKN